MTVKETIARVLSQQSLPWAYADSDINNLPRFNFMLIYNKTIRLSNKRSVKKPIYQIDYFSNQPEDVESSGVLNDLIDQLEAEKLIVGDWREVVTVNEEVDLGYYHYFIEVN